MLIRSETPALGRLEINEKIGTDEDHLPMVVSRIAASSVIGTLTGLVGMSNPGLHPETIPSVKAEDLVVFATENCLIEALPSEIAYLNPAIELQVENVREEVHQIASRLSEIVADRSEEITQTIDLRILDDVSGPSWQDVRLNQMATRRLSQSCNLLDAGRNRILAFEGSQTRELSRSQTEDFCELSRTPVARFTSCNNSKRQARITV